MKASTTALRNLIQRGYEVRAKPKVFAEWEHNRFNEIESIAYAPVVTVDDEQATYFDINSIGLPNRPRTGIAKARANGKGRATTGYRDFPTQARFYAATEDDIYKYWSSPQVTKLTKATDGGYEFQTPIEVSLLYKNSVPANKIVVGFETSYAKPVTFTIEITTNGTSWQTVLNTGSLDSSGRVELWRNNRGSWTTTVDYVNPASVKGVRTTIYSMDTAYAHVDVLQLGLRLENDLTDFVAGYDRDYEVSDTSYVAPLGKASSNNGKLYLSNYDGRFNKNNESSIYYGMIGKGVQFRVDLSFDVSKMAGSADERIRELTMWSEEWSASSEEDVAISLTDSSEILQRIASPQVFWENLTVGAIVWQLMDLVGMTNYAYTRSTFDSGQVIPYYWPKDGDTVWETMASLAEVTQTAIYFDEYDVLQIKTRQALFDKTQSVDWNLDAVQNGQKLPDIVTLETDEEQMINSVDVTYRPTKYSDFNNGFPKMETVWEPEDDTVVLRASSLVKDLLTNSDSLWINQAEAALWPYDAMINIRGEILSYKGKEYNYYKVGGGTTTEIVYSLEEKTAVDAKSDQNLSWANSFTGKFMIDKRGLSGTLTSNHKVREAGYTGAVTNYSDTKYRPENSTAYMNVNNGVMTLTSPPDASQLDFYLVKHEASLPTNKDIIYGTRFRFPEQQLTPQNYTIAGLWIQGDNGDAGYYIEVSTTELVDGLEGRSIRNEISMFKMPANNEGVRIPTTSGEVKGVVANIVRGPWYELDAKVSRHDGIVEILVYLNGVIVGVWNDPISIAPPHNGKFGIFTRYQCVAEFDYLYGVTQDKYSDFDQSSFFDLVNGGFISGFIEREWRYSSYFVTLFTPARSGGAIHTAKTSLADYAYDEFGPVVHEVREYDIKFDESDVPVNHSYLYLSNTSQAVCVAYNANPFGAKFVIANAYRANAIIKGDDTLTLGTDNPITHKVFIYGRKLMQEDDVSIQKTDEFSIRKNGLNTLEFDNMFLQTKENAESLADWMVDLWSEPSDSVSVEIFGNPLIQIGDLVTVNYPARKMAPTTHKYVVVRVSNSFDEGLETSLLLRRLRV